MLEGEWWKKISEWCPAPFPDRKSTNNLQAKGAAANGIGLRLLLVGKFR